MPGSDRPSGLMRCTVCKGMLNSSGREPYRFICADCGRHFFVTLQIVEVPSSDARSLPILPGGEDVG